MASYSLTQTQTTPGMRCPSGVKRTVTSRAPNSSYQSRNNAFGSASPVCDGWVESWTTKASVASSVKRSVTSSPTESRDRTSAPVMPCSNVVLGFDAPSSSTSSSGSLKPLIVGAGRSLLSQALTTNSDVRVSTSVGSQHKQAYMPLLSPVRQCDSEHADGLPMHSAGDDFFPEVDRTLLEQSQERHNVFKSELVVNAYMIAGRAYANQQRHDGTSVLSHCVLTALTLADYGMDEKTVAAGLLADVLHNDEVFRSQLEEFMPSDVVALVDRVTTITTISDLYRGHRGEMDDEKLRGMMLAMEDVQAVLIKLAHRVHEMAACARLPQPARAALAQETLDIYAVVANRLGCWCIKADLEDAAFAVLHPEEYEAVRAAVRSRQDPAALEATVSAIKSALDERGIVYEDISGRTKNLYSVWRKMVADGVTSIDTIYDLIALRVVVSGNKHDCYFAQRAVQQLYRCMPERSKDFVRVIKKANGYQSLHETIYGEAGMPVEVQIRTHKMHYIAEYGFAAHWKYKENLDNDDKWMDKEVQYKKWLMSYKLGFHDKKVRPSGSSPTDGSLKSLGAHLLDMAGLSDEAAAMVDPFLMHDRFKLRQPARRTVRVMLQTQDSVEQREVSAALTAGQLSAELCVASLPGYVLTVNQRLADDAAPLRDGDLVQVLPLTQHLMSRSPPEARGHGMAAAAKVAAAAAAAVSPSASPPSTAVSAPSQVYLPMGMATGGGVPHTRDSIDGELEVYGLSSDAPVTVTMSRRSSDWRRARRASKAS
uniref:RelA/SpoT domain-containing protein n=1 Tax=Chlamydomonas euryale TaxID=1486919 RepID=A0A7R9VEP8_9CHLO|mmetsp:Transcript_33413/g.99504  ORF Transcript_33413/g.99504 Transcript_33413/m.99504 type:complete len:767 (+) Transcript_33413:318-2618(+)